MSGSKAVCSFFAIVLIALSLYIPSNAYVKDIDAKNFQRGVNQFRTGSYYTAIDYFNKLLKNPNSPYFSKALLMLSKVYLKIGRKQRTDNSV
jgi:outer membrane protein assembly factor BamD (BamD/ComL family)